MSTARRSSSSSSRSVKKRAPVGSIIGGPSREKKNPSHKISFVKRAKVDGEDMVVGSGIYDLTDAEIDKLVKGQ